MRINSWPYRKSSIARAPGTDMVEVTVTVYSREDCHLCEEALETIERVASGVERHVEIREVDVDDDPELAAEYGERVPYVLVDGRPAFKFRVDAEELARRLRA
jgi:glutaredoxin